MLHLKIRLETQVFEGSVGEVCGAQAVVCGRQFLDRHDSGAVEFRNLVSGHAGHEPEVVVRGPFGLADLGPSADVTMLAFARIIVDRRRRIVEKALLEPAIIRQILVDGKRKILAAPQRDVHPPRHRALQPGDVFAVSRKLNEKICLSRSRKLGIDDLVAPRPALARLLDAT